MKFTLRPVAILDKSLSIYQYKAHKKGNRSYLIMIDIDYSKYNPDDLSKYLVFRKGNNHVNFDLFQNYVYFNENKKELVIEVDEYKGIRTPESKSMTPEEVLESVDEEDVKYYNQFGDFYINPHAGKTLFVSVGQGMIDFCEAEFEDYIDLIIALRIALEQENGKANTKVVHPKNIDDVINISKDRYASLYTMFNVVFNSNLYISISPPEIIGDFTKGVLHYKNYLKALQNEFREVLQFCFEVDFRPDDLGELNSAARYALYVRVNQILSEYSIEQNFNFDVNIVRMETEEINSIPSKDTISIRSQQNDFEKEYNLPPGWMDIVKLMPDKVEQRYSVSTLQDILMFELKCMIDLGIKMKICKNCNIYFILKGNYKTEYCDREIDGTSQTCQTPAAVTNYSKKVSNLPGWKEYNKYYKRYHARRRVGTINLNYESKT